VKVLDHGYMNLVESWGSDERIIEAARMSTQKGFQGWPQDEKLLRYLWKNNHATPFEMAGAVFEIQAPIFVFREWQRHRTQCLGPDTLVHFESPKATKSRRSVYPMRIEDVWRKWQPTKRTDRPERQTNAFWPRQRLQDMLLRRCNETTGEIEHTRIVGVIRGEPKPMIHVTTASGRELTATRAHRVFTVHGWMPLGAAIDRHISLALEGSRRGKLDGWSEHFADSIGEVWKAVPGWEDLYEVSSEGRVRRIGRQPKQNTIGAHGYLVVSLNRPGKQVTRTVHSLVAEAFLGPRPDGHEVRHKDHERTDARLCNLKYGTSAENSADMVAADRHPRLVTVYEEIVSVEDAGELPTFDLSVEGPWHNFIADGFVVHNSYNEMSARYAPLPDLNYVPTVERLMQNASGSNKQANRAEGAPELTEEEARWFQGRLETAYTEAEQDYQEALTRGVSKELARLALPVGRYSRMRASANLRNWLAFLTLRMAPEAQWEIRQYANAVHELLEPLFPRTMALFDEGRAA
jgi:flavin-dependent thymidylate synthase